jgi:hypothetical protein
MADYSAYHNQVMRVVQNDDNFWTVNITQGGVAVDITGWKIFLTAKSDPATEADADAAVQYASGVIADGGDGQHVVEFSCDTPGVYYGDLQLIDAEGDIQTPLLFRMIVNYETTRATS